MPSLPYNLNYGFYSMDNESNDNIRNEVGASLKNILKNKINYDLDHVVCSKVLLLYKKIIYNAEFSINREDAMMEDNKFKLESSFSEEFFRIKLNTK